MAYCIYPNYDCHLHEFRICGSADARKAVPIIQLAYVAATSYQQVLFTIEQDHWLPLTLMDSCRDSPFCKSHPCRELEHRWRWRHVGRPIPHYVDEGFMPRSYAMIYRISELQKIITPGGRFVLLSVRRLQVNRRDCPYTTYAGPSRRPMAQDKVPLLYDLRIVVRRNVLHGADMSHAVCTPSVDLTDVNANVHSKCRSLQQQRLVSSAPWVVTEVRNEWRFLEISIKNKNPKSTNVSWLLILDLVNWNSAIWSEFPILCSRIVWF